MHIRLLGVHQGESRNTKFLSILVDEVLAVDAGSLTSGLTFEEQKLLRPVFSLITTTTILKTSR